MSALRCVPQLSKVISMQAILSLSAEVFFYHFDQSGRFRCHLAVLFPLWTHLQRDKKGPRNSIYHFAHFRFQKPLLAYKIVYGLVGPILRYAYRSDVISSDPNNNIHYINLVMGMFSHMNLYRYNTHLYFIVEFQQLEFFLTHNLPFHRVSILPNIWKND